MRALSLLTLLVIAICLRFPFIAKDAPYFYNEDEAHHFNRVVDMVKTGSFDPNYFHKPSFHFYLRMPVVAASFLWQVSKGNVRSLDEITTHSKSGVAGYAFSASHPGILKWNRALSVLFSVLSVLLVFLIGKTLELSPVSCFFAALFSAISPALISESAVVGVDGIVVFLCLLSVLFALLSVQSRDGTKGLFLSAIVAGLAVSTKYNALPIILVPAAAALFGMSGIGGAITAIVLSLASFFAGSPFIFKHLPLFLDQFAYEIWHYKIAGHEGNSAEPGIAQLIFYSRWFVDSAVGWVVAVLAAFGVLLVFTNRKNHAAIVLVLFPVLYFYLMVNQRAHFTRNVLVLIPFISLFAVVSAEKLFARYKPILLGSLALGLVGFVPLYRANVQMFRDAPESRKDVIEFLLQSGFKNTAVDPQLQIAAAEIKRVHGSETTESLSPIQARLQGFNYLITAEKNNTGTIETNAIGKAVFSGGTQESGARIIQNPKLQLIDLNTIEVTPEIKRTVSQQSNVISSVVMKKVNGSFTCHTEDEPHCWIQTNIGQVRIPEISEDHFFSGSNGMVPVELELESPWAQTGLKISFLDFLADVPLPDLSAGEHKKIQLKLPYTELKDEKSFFITGITVLNPATEGVSLDTRRLGLAIKSLTLLPQ